MFIVKVVQNYNVYYDNMLTKNNAVQNANTDENYTIVIKYGDNDKYRWQKRKCFVLYHRLRSTIFEIISNDE